MLDLPSVSISSIFSHLGLQDFFNFSMSNSIMKRISTSTSTLSAPAIKLKSVESVSEALDNDKTMTFFLSTSFKNLYLSELTSRYITSQEDLNQLRQLKMAKTLTKIDIIAARGLVNFSPFCYFTRLTSLEIDCCFEAQMNFQDREQIIEIPDLTSLPLISLKLSFDNTLIPYQNLPHTLKKLHVHKFLIKTLDESFHLPFQLEELSLYHFEIFDFNLHHEYIQDLPDIVWRSILKLPLKKLAFDYSGNKNDTHDVQGCQKRIQRILDLQNITTLTDLRFSWPLGELENTYDIDDIDTFVDGLDHVHNDKDILNRNLCSSIKWSTNLKWLNILNASSRHLIPTLKDAPISKLKLGWVYCSQILKQVADLVQLEELDLFDTSFKNEKHLPILCDGLPNLKSLRLGNDGKIRNLHLLESAKFQTSLTKLNISSYSVPMEEGYDSYVDGKRKEMKIIMPSLPNLKYLNAQSYLLDLPTMNTLHIKYPNLTSLASPHCYDPIIESAILPMKKLHTIYFHDYEDLKDEDYRALANMSTIATVATVVATDVVENKTSIRFIGSPENEKKFRSVLQCTLRELEIEILNYNFFLYE